MNHERLWTQIQNCFAQSGRQRDRAKPVKRADAREIAQRALIADPPRFRTFDRPAGARAPNVAPEGDEGPVPLLRENGKNIHRNRRPLQSIKAGEQDPGQRRRQRPPVQAEEAGEDGHQARVRPGGVRERHAPPNGQPNDENIHKKVRPPAQLGHAGVENDREQGHDCVRGEEPGVAAADRIPDPLVPGDVAEARVAEEGGGDAPVEEEREPEAENAAGAERGPDRKERPDLEQPVHREPEEHDIAHQIVPVERPRRRVVEALQTGEVPLVAVGKGDDAEELGASEAAAHPREDFLRRPRAC